MQCPSATVPVTLREGFMTDPFFQSSRQILEKCLFELYGTYQEQQATEPHPITTLNNATACCCSPESETAVTSLRNWMPAVLIPCLQCCHDQLPSDQKCQSAHGYSYSKSEVKIQKFNQLQNTSEQLSNQMQDLHILPPNQFTMTQDCFQLILNIQGFLPSDITVTVIDNCIEVKAERMDTSFPEFSETVVKRYDLPCPINTLMVNCSLSKDNILLLTAPWRL